MRPILNPMGILLSALLLLAACGGEPSEESAESTDDELMPPTETKAEATEEPSTTPTPAAEAPEKTARTESTRQPARTEGVASAPAQLLGTRWELVELEGKPVSKGAGGKSIYIQLGSSGDEVTGFAGCNSFTGSYELDRNRLSFGPLAATRMACPDGDNPEQQFLKVLGAIEQFDITPNRLALSTERSHGVAKFVAKGSR